MSKQQSGLETLRATANKIALEVQASKQAAIEAAQLSPEAMEYMNRHAATGASDLNTGVSIPQLRIHSTGVSTKNQLPDGSDPDDGQIFYTGDQQAFDSVNVILLAIKKCRLEQQNDDGSTTMKANYLLAGLLDETLQPFIIYVKGMSYKKIWDLEDQLKPYVTKRAGGIPLSMVKVTVSSQKEVVEQGKYKGQKKNVFKFQLLMHESGQFPVLEGDGEKLAVLESSTQKAEDMLEQIISGKGMTEKEWNQQKNGDKVLEQTVAETIVDGDVQPTNDDFDVSDDSVADDIPF